MSVLSASASGSTLRRCVAAGAVAAAVIGSIAPTVPAGRESARDDVAQPDCDAIWQRDDTGFYESNPTYVEKRDDTSDWKFSSPRAQGLDGPVLRRKVKRLY